MARGQLVVFDAEGVIIPKGHFLLKIVQHYRPRQLPRLVFYGSRYLLGLFPLKKVVKELFRTLQGLPEETIRHVMSDIALKPGVEDVFRRLKENSCVIAVISSGIPQTALEALVPQLGIDHAVGPVLETDGGLLTGEVSGHVLERDGKSEVLERLIQDNGYGGYRVVSVADDRNNVSLFRSSSVAIGFNPDFLLQLHSDHVVDGRLANILPLITGENRVDRRAVSLSMVLRKTVHASTMIIPLFLVGLLGKPAVIGLLFLAMGLYLVSETSRVLGKSIPLFTWFTLLNTTDSEASEFVDDPLFFALGLALPLMLFPDDVAFASIAVLALGDSVAALIGTLVGRHSMPLCKGKSVEGTLGGFAAAYLGASLFLGPTGALVAAFFGTMVEALPSPFNDNLVIPLAAGAAVLLTCV